jgi:type II secretory pathway pseudopilin PulG
MPRVLKRILCVVAGSFAIVILIAIALPRTSHASGYSQEIRAIGAMRTIHTMQVQYFSRYGEYAASLKELGPPAGLMDGELASGTKDGYRFTMTGNASGYAIHADPESFGKTGSRTFYSDQTMTIRQNRGQQPATINSPEMK